MEEIDSDEGGDDAGKDGMEEWEKGIQGIHVFYISFAHTRCVGGISILPGVYLRYLPTLGKDERRSGNRCFSSSSSDSG